MAAAAAAAPVHAAPDPGGGGAPVVVVGLGGAAPSPVPAPARAYGKLDTILMSSQRLRMEEKLLCFEDDTLITDTYLEEWIDI